MPFFISKLFIKKFSYSDYIIIKIDNIINELFFNFPFLVYSVCHQTIIKNNFLLNM